MGSLFILLIKPCCRLLQTNQLMPLLALNKIIIHLLATYGTIIYLKLKLCFSTNMTSLDRDEKSIAPRQHCLSKVSIKTFPKFSKLQQKQAHNIRIYINKCFYNARSFHCLRILAILGMSTLNLTTLLKWNKNIVKLIKEIMIFCIIWIWLAAFKLVLKVPH